MAQFNVTTTGLVGTVNIDDLHLTLTHPQTIDLINDATDQFTWAEILESNDLQTAINAGEVNCTDMSANPITNVTLDAIAVAAGASAPVSSVFSRTGAVVAQASDYDDSQVDFTYTPSNFTATSAFVAGALEGIDNALAALQGDGNDTPIVRGDAITGVAPTAGEVPSPIAGDTASVFLTDGTLERWVFTTVWSLAYTLDANQATNLSYTPSPTDGTITSSTGSNATLPAATGTNAGLLLPGDFTKLGFITITQPVDLDALETASHAAVTLGGGNDARLTLSGQELTLDGSDIDSLISLSGVAAGSTDLGTFTGSIISDNIALKAALQELETELESRVYGTEFQFFQSLAVSSTTSTTFQNKISDTTTNLPAGTYEITISYTWNHNAVNNDFEARFLFGGNAVGQDATGLIHKAEPKDAAGNFSGTGSNQRYQFTNTYYVVLGAAGTQTVVLDFRTDNNGVNSSIWDASIKVIRVA